MINKKEFNFFLEKEDSIIFIGHRLEIFIPSYFFEQDKESGQELATIYGDKAETIGMFSFKVFRTESSKTPEIYSMSIPINLDINIYDFEENVEDDIDGELEKFTKIIYEKDDIFIENTNIVIDADVSVGKFMRLLMLGKLPKSIKYHELLEVFLNAMETSGVKLDVYSTILEVILSESTRIKKYPNKPFRLLAGKSAKYGEDDYEMYSIVEIPRLSSTFTGLLFERLNDSIISGINNSRLNRDEQESPLEEVIKY